MSDTKELTRSQRMAIEYVAQVARTRKWEAQKSIGEILRMSNIGWEPFEAAVAKLLAHARVALHFHPDRPTADMKSVAQALL